MTEGETVEEISLTSELGEELKDIIRDSYLDTEFDSRWLPAKVQLIRSKCLQSSYDEKREESLIRGRTSEELAEQYGFTVENNASALQTLCVTGFTTHDSDYNALGYSCMGIYLCRHADVCLRHAVVKYSGSPVIRLVVCKYMLGRHTTAIPRVASSADFIQPTQDFDCHVSVLPPSKSDSLQSQYDRSQVYLYDINALLQPLLRPRQLVPYAIVTYTQDGAPPSVDDEPLKSDVPPQLQHIIQRINAKAEGHAAVPASLRPPLDNFNRPSASASGHAGVTQPQATISVVGGGKKPAVEGDVSGDGSDANLQRVIAQINARLESQERSKQVVVQTATAHGSGPSTLPASVQSDLYLAAASRIAARSEPISASAGRVDPAAAMAGTLGILPTAESGLAGYSGGLAAAGLPKMSVPAGVSLAAGAGYMALAAGGRSAQFAVAPELVGGSAAALAGLQYPSTPSLLSASPYLRTLPGMVDTTGVAALDAATMLASQQLKYFPYQSAAQSRDVPVVGTAAAAAAGGFYPLQSVLPADALGAGYTLVNSSGGGGAGVKRSLNDVMLYMVDKRPRYY